MRIFIIRGYENLARQGGRYLRAQYLALMAISKEAKEMVISRSSDHSFIMQASILKKKKQA